MVTNPHCLLIDADEAALQELTGLLPRHTQSANIYAVAGIPQALPVLRERRIDILFIRIKDWDDYRRVLPMIPEPPDFVVFLSSRKEKGARMIDESVDFHLQGSYRPAELARIFARINDGRFTPRALDMFFLKSGWKVYVIHFSALKAVSSKGRVLTIQTDRAEYQVGGSLSGLQERLPPMFCRVGPSLLVAGREVLGGASISGFAV